MSLALLPALDIASGSVARADASPADVASRWHREGAEWIHLVDLDDAFGHGSNEATLAAVVEATDVQIQLSGGIRNEASLKRAIGLRTRRVVVAADALADLGWCARAVRDHGDRIVVALDVDTGGDPNVADPEIAPRGGSLIRRGLWATLDALDRAGCARYLVTDVERDGRVNGPNLVLLDVVAQRTPGRIVASGGVSCANDIADLARLARHRDNVDGAVVGTALLNGGLSLPAALAAARDG